MLFRLKDHGKADAAEKRGAKYRPRSECGKTERSRKQNTNKGDWKQDLPEIHMSDAFNHDPYAKYSKDHIKYTNSR